MSDKRPNTVYISIGDSAERILTILTLQEMGLTILDAAETPDDPLDYFTKKPFAYLMDANACKRHEYFLRTWYVEIDDNTPLIFWGKWTPPFFHRSLIDITGLASVDLKAMLCFIQKHRQSDTDRPYIFYPYREFSESEYFINHSPM